MRTRALPINIHAHPDGLLVRVKRAGMLYKAFVPKGHPNALERAIQLRDNFLRQFPQTIRVATRSCSNTGIVGISEMVKWYHNKPYDCFSVSWPEPGGRRGFKRIVYHRWEEREAALQRAITLRKEKTEVASV